MAYRIRNFDNFSVERVNEIFRRGRGLGRGPAIGAAPAEDEDFISPAVDHDPRLPIVSMPPAEVLDDELESVQ